MTTILPSARTPFEAIMEQVGSGLSQTLPAAMQRRGERQQGLTAIDQLQSDLASSGGDLTKMIPAIARAYTLNPSLERSGIAEKLIPLAQRKTGATEFPAGGGKNNTQGHPLTKQEVPVGVADLVPSRQSSVQNPQGTMDFQLPYGPDEIAAIRQQSRQLGYTPEMEERFVADAQEYNKIAQNRREIELQNYQQQQQERRDTLENQNAFEKYLATHSPEFVNNPDELELALKASERFQNEPSFAARNAKVKNELRPYQAAKNALQKNLNRPLFGMTEEQRKLNRPRAQMMVNMGQKPQLQLMIAKGGLGEVEEADLLNPLPNNVEKGLQSLTRFTRPLEKVTNIDPDSEEYAKQLARGSEVRLKQKDHAVAYLSDAIKPGKDYSNPGTNLLLVRYNLMQKGSDWNEAAQIIDDAIKKGNIKLDSQQQIDWQKLGMPPLTGETYSDTILNNILFPITGKQ